MTALSEQYIQSVWMCGGEGGGLREGKGGGAEQYIQNVFG